MTNVEERVMKHYRLLPALALSTALALALLASCGGGGEPEQHTFDITLEGGQPVAGAATYTVKQNDMVTMVVTSDEHVSLHLHGYNVVGVAAPGQPATLALTASATGSFPLTVHVGGRGHGEVFGSPVMQPGDTFTFTVPEGLAGQDILFHSHFHGEVNGVITVADDASLPESVEIDVRDLAAHPSRVTVRAGTEITWRNSDSVSHGIVSGPHAEVGSEGESEHGEVELGRLEVHPR